MQSIELNTLLKEGTRLRTVLAFALAAALAVTSFMILSTSSQHHAGAATVTPHAVDAYMFFSLNADKITGEGSTGGPGTIPVDSFSWGASRNIGSQSSGAGAGKVTFNPFSITRKIDRSSSHFFQDLVVGTHLATATFYMSPPAVGAKSGDAMNIAFTNLVVTSIIWTGTSHSATPPQEVLTMVPQTARVTYTPGG